MPRHLGFLATAVLWLVATIATAAPRIGVATMQPGEIFWERFGHDALVVDDPARGPPMSYNFGFFDPAEPDFIGRFVRGDMQYQLVALPLEEDLRYYRETGRGVSIQWLDLDDAQASALAAALADNAKPENARYSYDYFTDNCATRVRDALDVALDGHLRRQLQTRSLGDTYRSESVRLASPALWMWLGFDIGLGPFADRPLSLWDSAFVPMRLAHGLRDAKGTGGRPLVASEEQVLPHRIAPEPASRPRLLWPWILAGLLGAAGIWWLARRAPRGVIALALPFWILCGVLGATLLYLWGFTAHRAAWSNHNLLLFNPLCLLLLPGAIALLRGRNPGHLFAWVFLLVLTCALLAPFSLWLPREPQRNGAWIALMLPLHVALWWVLARGRLAARHQTQHDVGHD